MRKVDRLAQFALVVFKPIQARIDLVPMVINPGGPTSRLGPKPCLVSNLDYRFTHALSEGVVCQHQRCLASCGIKIPPPARESRYSQITVESKIVSPESVRSAGTLRNGLRLRAYSVFGRPGTTSAYSS